MSSHSVSQDEEAATVSDFLCKGTERSSRDKLNSKYFLKPLLRAGHHPFCPHFFGEGKPMQSPKSREQEGEYTLPTRDYGQVAGWINN